MNGDADAFGLLFARHRERLWAVALRTLGNPDDAADALQDAMISAFRRAGGYRGDAAVTTWLHRIVVNACLDRLRRQAVRPAASGLDEQTMDSLRSHQSSRPDETAAADVSLEVTAALRELPAEQRAALVLVDMLGYAVADAAETLGISAGTVKSRCARGRAKLLPRLAHLRATAGSDAGTPEAAATGQAGGGGGATDGDGRNQPAPGRVSPAKGGGERAS